MLVEADFGQVAPCYREIERCRRQNQCDCAKESERFLHGFSRRHVRSYRVIAEQFAHTSRTSLRLWILVAGSEKSADKTANDSCAEGYPAFIFAAMMMALVVSMGFWPRSRMVVDVLLGGRPFRRGRALCRLMFWSVPGCVSIAATRSCESRSANCNQRKSEYQKLFECLVHVAPSLSFCRLCGPYAAYIKVGRIIFFS